MSDAPILGQTNTVTNLDDASDFERKHTPFIALEDAEGGMKVTVEVGHYVSHPNDPDHFIGWIELYAGDSPIARFDLSPVAVAPEVSVVVKIDPGTTIRALEYCNLHGLWAAEIEV